MLSPRRAGSRPLAELPGRGQREPGQPGGRCRHYQDRAGRRVPAGRPGWGPARRPAPRPWC